VHPLLVGSVAKGAQMLGVGLTNFEIIVLTMTAALPSASNVSVLAERYGADDGRVARIIMTSTAISFLTLSALAWVLGLGR
jgi:predicted permease